MEEDGVGGWRCGEWRGIRRQDGGCAWRTLPVSSAGYTASGCPIKPVSARTNNATLYCRIVEQSPAAGTARYQRFFVLFSEFPSRVAFLLFWCLIVHTSLPVWRTFRDIVTASSECQRELKKHGPFRNKQRRFLQTPRSKTEGVLPQEIESLIQQVLDDESRRAVAIG